jgi:hypothetical protein
MISIESWAEAFGEAVALWNDFEQTVNDSNRRTHQSDWRTIQGGDQFLAMISQGMVQGLDDRLVSNLRNWKKALKPKYRDFTRRVVSGYLEHIAANLCLSDVLGATIHEWSDIGPIYREKLSRSVRVQDDVNFRHQDECRTLFEVSFPELRPRGTSDLIKILEDRRVESLRKMISEAVAGRIIFDREFAVRIQGEVCADMNQLERRKKFIAILSSPLNRVPWIGPSLERTAQQIANRFLERRAQHNHQWFFLLDDVKNYR